MPSTSIKNKETKHQAGTAQTPVIQRHPHQFSPVLWLSPSLCSLSLHRAELGVDFQYNTPAPTHTQSTTVYPVSVLDTQNCSQSFSRGISDPFLRISPRWWSHHPWHSLRDEAFTAVPQTRGAAMANLCFKTFYFHSVGNKTNKDSKNQAEALTLPGAVRLSIPIRSCCSSVSFWKFSRRMRLFCSCEVISVTSFSASVWRTAPMGPEQSNPGHPFHPWKLSLQSRSEL